MTEQQRAMQRYHRSLPRPGVSLALLLCDVHDAIDDFDWRHQASHAQWIDEERERLGIPSARR